MQGTRHSPTDTHLISPEIWCITPSNGKCEDSFIRFLCENAPGDSNSSIEKNLVTDNFSYTCSISLRMESQFIKVFLKKEQNLIIWNV